MGLLERIRGEGTAEQAPAGGQGAGLVDRLGSLARRGHALVDRVADGVKEVAARGLLKDAADAHARGNLGAAFYLAMEASEAEPGDRDADGLFWDLALDFGHPEAARQSAANLVAHHVGRGALELAAQFFSELVHACGAPPIDPAVLVRVVPELVARLERAEAEADKQSAAEGDAKPEDAVSDETDANDPRLHRATLLAALRLCIDPANVGMSPGLAMRMAEMARPWDCDVALAAAHVALAADDVHEAKRAKLVALVRELDPAAEIEDAPPFAEPSLETGPVAEAPGGAPFSAVTTTAVVPRLEEISDAETDRLASMLEPAEEELEAVAMVERTDAEMLPELQPIDDGDPARNHPNRIESPAHDALSDDEVGRMRERIERALGARSAPPPGGGVTGTEPA